MSEFAAAACRSSRAFLAGAEFGESVAGAGGRGGGAFAGCGFVTSEEILIGEIGGVVVADVMRDEVTTGAATTGAVTIGGIVAVETTVGEVGVTGIAAGGMSGFEEASATVPLAGSESIEFAKVADGAGDGSTVDDARLPPSSARESTVAAVAGSCIVELGIRIAVGMGSEDEEIVAGVLSA